MRLFEVVATAYKKLRKAPGKSVVIQLETELGEQRELELYQQPGLASGPTPGDQVATINLGGYRVGVATQNYKVEVDVAAGTTTIYSTDADGETLQSTIVLTADGEIHVNGETKTFVTHAELDASLQTFITALNAHVHTSGGSGSPTSSPVTPMSVDISTAETTTVKTGG